MSEPNWIYCDSTGVYVCETPRSVPPVCDCGDCGERADWYGEAGEHLGGLEPAGEANPAAWLGVVLPLALALCVACVIGLLALLAS